LLKDRLVTVPPLFRSLIQVRLHIAQAGHTLSSAHMVRPCRSPTSCRQSVPDFSPAVLPAQTPCAPEPPAPDSESAHPTVRAVWKAPIYPHLISSPIPSIPWTGLSRQNDWTYHLLSYHNLWQNPRLRVFQL